MKSMIRAVKSSIESYLVETTSTAMKGRDQPNHSKCEALSSTSETEHLNLVQKII